MYKFFFKRLIDIVLSSITIFLISLLFFFIMLILLLTGEHYVFYFQKRIGYKNKPFHIYKFVNNGKNSPNIGSGLHTTKRPRITNWRFLEKLNLMNCPNYSIFYLGP